jgi:hypothetical protein
MRSASVTAMICKLVYMPHLIPFLNHLCLGAKSQAVQTHVPKHLQMHGEHKAKQQRHRRFKYGTQAPRLLAAMVAERFDGQFASRCDPPDHTSNHHLTAALQSVFTQAITRSTLALIALIKPTAA